MYHIIVNPSSRSGRGQKLWSEQIEPVLKSRNIPYEAFLSKCEGDVAALARKITTDPSVESPVRLLVLGGDGTINEALQGIADFSKTIIGYIPTGSSNDFARDIYLPKDPVKTLELILSDPEPIAMDLGTVRYADNKSRLFINSCGYGYDAAVVEGLLRAEKVKRAFNTVGLGKLVYFYIALTKLFSAPDATAKFLVDDNEPVVIPKTLFAVSLIHCYEGGGFKFCPDADYADGILDICSAGNMSRLKIPPVLPLAFLGKHFILKGIRGFKGERFRMETSVPFMLHTDGEYLGETKYIEVSCEKQALKVIAPRG